MCPFRRESKGAQAQERKQLSVTCLVADLCPISRTPWGGMTLSWMLLLLPLARAALDTSPRDPQDIDRAIGAAQGAALYPPRPHIYHCRSPNMETFTCWWRFPDDVSQGNSNISYTLTYTVGKGPPQECPDYVTGGAHSCFFDSHHTQVWEVYCMNVTVRSGSVTRTSEEHCLDVADIVETDPPLNLTYQLTSCADGPGCSVLVSWQYPVAVDVQMGWVTLIYELQFRRKSDPHNWKVKGGLREPQLELLDLPVGSYIMKVRCKSRNAKLWSEWSSPLIVNIPPKRGIAVPDKMLAAILVTGIGVIALIIAAFGVIPQGKRLKAFLLPPVPKPRIRGIDSVLLKSGKIDEINHLFSSFRGYTPPQCSEEVLLQVVVDEGPSLKESSVAQSSKKEVEKSSRTQGADCLIGQQVLHKLVEPAQYTQVPAACFQNSACDRAESVRIPATETLAPQQPASDSAHSDSFTFPPVGYSVVSHTAPLQPASHDFYTCVNGIGVRGAVHLVPCLPDPKIAPFLQFDVTASPAKKGVPEMWAGLSGQNRQGQRVDVSQAPVPGSTAFRVGLDLYTTLDDLRLGREHGTGVDATQ